MRPKFFQNLSRYCISLSLAVLSSCLWADIVRLQTIDKTTASDPVSGTWPVGARIVAQDSAYTTGLAQQGRKLYEAGQFSEAVKAWQFAAKAFQSQGNTLNHAQALNHLSLAYQQLGSYFKANRVIRDSVKLLQTDQDASGSKQRLKILAQALNIQGQLQLAQGQTELALSTWQQATATYAQAGDETGIIGSLLNQAQALQALGLYRRALATLNDVNQRLQKQPNSTIKAAGLRSLGNAMQVVGDLDQSRQTLQHSLAVAQQLKSPPDIAAALFGLGNVASSQGCGFDLM